MSNTPATAELLRRQKSANLFSKKNHMMYGFGDEQNPLPETVEDIVVEYVTDLDLPKLNRCRELLAMQEELKQARKAFDVGEEKITSLD